MIMDSKVRVRGVEIIILPRNKLELTILQSNISLYSGGDIIVKAMCCGQVMVGFLAL